MKVLVATDDRTFSVALCEQYRRLGYEVQTGTRTLFTRQGKFEFVHCHWPEELCGWTLPFSARRTKDAIDTLKWWRKRATVICSVHNLLPHDANPNDKLVRSLYSEYYQQMHHIGHFSETSCIAVRAAFPEVPYGRHFVHGLNSFDNLKALAPTAQEARKTLGLSDGQIAALVFGQLRSAEEVELVYEAAERISDQGIVVLFCARLPKTSIVRQAAARLRHKWWSLRYARYQRAGYIDDVTVATLLTGADVLMVPRFGRHLNSGLLPLALSFSTPMAAPDYGIYREYLAGSLNQLYEPGSAEALARAVTCLAAKGSSLVRESNAMLAAQFGWDRVTARIMQRVRAK